MTERKEFSAGDKVWCEHYGEGVVKDVDTENYEEYWRMEVHFGSHVECFSLDGWYSPMRNPSRRIKHIEEPKKEETAMRAFAAGDRVTCEKFGEGQVTGVGLNEEKYYQVSVRFHQFFGPLYFSADGHYAFDALEDERIRHIEEPASSSSPDFIQELINAQGVKPITDPGFEEAAQKLAQKLAYAILNKDNVSTVFCDWIIARRRPNQSERLWQRACFILVSRGLVFDTITEDALTVYIPPKKGAK